MPQLKGHLPEALHYALLEQLAGLVPGEASVTILGDGDYDGTDWQAAIVACGWQYVRRIASDILLTLAETTIARGDLGPKHREVIAVEQFCVSRRCVPCPRACIPQRLGTLAF